jgi:hypothetical protein
MKNVKTLLLAGAVVLGLNLTGCNTVDLTGSNTSTKNSPERQADKEYTVALKRIHQDIKVLAADAFGGRGPLPAGETLTINYLAEQYQQAGLQPGANGRFLQKVAMATLTPDQRMKLTIGDLSFNAGSDFTARIKQIREHIKLEQSELMYVGYGINAPQYQWNDSQGLDYLTAKTQALSRQFKSKSLKLKANLTLNSQISQAESHNVVALLPGTEQADEYVIVSAATLEIARLMAQRAKITGGFKRSLLFVNFTAKETGLIGSELFGAGSVYPTRQMVGILNIDGMDPLDGVDYILQYGKGMSQIEGYRADAAKAQGRRVKMDPRPQNGLFFRSDHFSMAKQGVPGLLFMSLGDTDPDYIPYKYHKEADDYSPQWSLGGVEQDVGLVLNIATKLASSKDWPQWKSTSDFSKRRALDGLK